MQSEFDFTNNIKKKYGLRYLGDDCAVLPKDADMDMVVTADMLVEGIDFRRDWAPPELLGQKVLAVSLSDIAAMGSDPKWAMISIGVPERLWTSNFIDRFYEGWFEMAREFSVDLVGGDISRTPDKLVFDSIVGGEVQIGRALLRSGAQPGDAIFVTGTLGGAAGGLMLLEAGVKYADTGVARKRLIERQIRPVPRIDIGKWLSSTAPVTAAIDISDGVSSDLAHICNASGVGARIYSDRIPVDPDLQDIAMTDDARIGLALNGGEDFELLFTASPDFEGVGDRNISRIGEITNNTGIVENIAGGEIYVLPPTGYRHF